MRVDILLNTNTRDSFMRGYQPGDPMVRGGHFEVEAWGPIDACNKVWRLANVGDDPDFGTPDPQAVEYRENRQRSLSIGDIVVVGEQAYSVEPTCFEPLPEGAQIRVVDGHWMEYDSEGNRQ